MVRRRAAWSPPGALLSGHRAPASLADKAALCLHQRQAEEDSFALPEQGVVAGAGWGAPSLLVSQGDHVQREGAAAAQLRLMVAMWELGPGVPDLYIFPAVSEIQIFV